MKGPRCWWNDFENNERVLKWLRSLPNSGQVDKMTLKLMKWQQNWWNDHENNQGLLR
jgi:hypothetical protein